MLRWMLWMVTLMPLVWLGCPSGDDDDDTAGDDDAVGDDDDTVDDDDDTVGDDDDTVGDDDDTVGASMSLSETEFFAGAWPTVQLTTDGFEIDDATAWCCYDETALEPSGTANVTATSMDVMLMIGLLAEGTQTLGLENDGVQVSADLEITAFPIDDVDAGLAAGSGVAGGDTEYDAFHFTGAAADQFVTLTPTNLGVDFQPYVWVTESDGITFRAQNWYPPENTMTPSVGVYLFEQTELYARICAADFANDAAQTFDLDVVVEAPLAALDEAEVEPNDDAADPQDLGTLIAGTVMTLTGEVDAVGHDAQNTWNEDLDFFAFEVSHDSTLSVQLDWGDGADDYDLVMYDVSQFEPDLPSFDHVVGWWHAATLNFPERTSSVLYAGVPYVLFVGGWEGNPGAYEVLLALSPLQ